MASSKKTSTPKADVEETKTQETKAAEVTPAADEKKNDAVDKAVGAATSTPKADVEEKPKPFAVAEADLELPGFKDAGIVVGDDLASISSKFTARLKEVESDNKPAKSEKKTDDKASKATKNEVVAEKGGVTRIFSKSTWDKLGSTKNGWKQKVETPKEAKGGK